MQDCSSRATCTGAEGSPCTCHRCGNHQSNVCRFRFVNCRACGKKGHIAKVCRSKLDSRKPPKHPQSQRKGQRSNTPYNELCCERQPASRLSGSLLWSLNQPLTLTTFSLLLMEPNHQSSSKQTGNSHGD